MSYRLITIEDRTFKYKVGRRDIWVEGIGSVHIGLVGRSTDVSMDEYEVTPKNIESFIRTRLDIPRIEKPVPKPKKVDPGPKTRGFAKLVGVEIERIEASCVNQVILHGTDGSRFVIDADIMGVLPIITCTQECLPDPSYD